MLFLNHFTEILQSLAYTILKIFFNIGGFHVMSSPPCWWTVNKDSSLVRFVCPPAFVHFTIVICVSRDCMKTTYTDLSRAKSEALDNIYILFKQNTKSCNAKRGRHATPENR